MSVDAKLFPLSLASLNKSIMFQTDITVGKGGHESRNAIWQDPLLMFNASSGIKDRDDVATLEAFFYSVRGRETGFLLKDLNDYQIPQSGTTAQSIGTGNGVTTTFQIVKLYTDALSQVHTRTITRISTTNSHLKVYVNGALQTYTTHYTSNKTTGVITFVTAPPNGHAVTITLDLFWVPVRFDTDILPVDLLYHAAASDAVGSSIKTLANLPEVPLIEVRV